MVQLNQDLQKGRGIGLLTGTVESEVKEGAILVGLYRQGDSSLELVHIDRLTSGQRHFVFVLESASSYRVFAVQDVNGDQGWQPGEPTGDLSNGRFLQVAAGQRLEDLVLTLTRAKSVPSVFQTDFSSLDLEALESIPIATGELVRLDDERFSTDQAKQGMWTPLSSAQKVGAGIYFLEPYDPARVPVIFVHGIGGSPRDFASLIDGLDRSRMQPWVHHYPSGLRLSRVARSLARQIRALKQAHGFESAILTAHSMGGLVARGALLDLKHDPDNEEHFPIDLFVTFSTPWDGHSAAAGGVKYAPAVVPSWIDMKPGSDFLMACREPLPNGLPHHLFFGYRTGNNPLMLYSHDSVVSVASQLAHWAQSGSDRTYGYNLDHVEILSDEQVHIQFNAILEEHLR